MLADRDYMRESSGRAPWSMTAKLMVALVVAFAATEFLLAYGNRGILDYLLLELGGVKRGWLWQFLTFQFLHGSLLHLAGNLLGLWFCGRLVERVMGSGRFLVFYLGCGVVGGMLQILLAALVGGPFLGPVIGASAGVMAVVALFCLIQPNAEFLLFFIVPVKARYLLIGETAIALFFTLVPRADGIAHAAHLGGIVAAVLWFRARWHDDLMPLPWEGLMERFRGALRRRPPARVIRPTGWSRPRVQAEPAPPKPEPTAAEFMEREVDPILDKIAAHGLQSLTEREKKILEAARDRMAKR